MIYDPSNLSNSRELTRAVYAVVEKLVKRGYLHLSDDIEFVRPGHKSVFPCGKRNELEGSLDLSQLKWAAEHGSFWFLWYKGAYLRLEVHNGPIRCELKLDPTRQNPWEFAYTTVERFE
jgi:hypothetical protein